MVRSVLNGDAKGISPIIAEQLSLTGCLHHGGARGGWATGGHGVRHRVGDKRSCVETRFIRGEHQRKCR